MYAGVPQYCVNILGPLRDGDAVFLSSRVLTAQVNFTIRTSYALLPIETDRCFIDKKTKEIYDVDFFDASHWEEYRLSPCVGRPLPPLQAEQEHSGLMGSIVGSMASVLPVLSGRSSSPRRRFTVGETTGSGTVSSSQDSSAEQEIDRGMEGVGDRGMQPHMGQNNYDIPAGDYKSLTTPVTLRKNDAMEYLARTLTEVKTFKRELEYKPELAEEYPPTAILYGKSVPTVVGAYVNGRDGIKRADAYDDLAFASGDGVVLARAAQIPRGYRVVKGGVASTSRGHIGLLGDLEAVGQCIIAILAEQNRRFRSGSESGGSSLRHL